MRLGRVSFPPISDIGLLCRLSPSAAMTGRGALDGRLGIIPMTSDGDGALFIALTTLVAMLDEKGLLSEQEFIDALQGEQKGRSDGLKMAVECG